MRIKIKGWHINFTDKEHKLIIMVKERLMERYHMRKLSHHDFILNMAEHVDVVLTELDKHGN